MGMHLKSRLNFNFNNAISCFQPYKTSIAYVNSGFAQVSNTRLRGNDLGHE